jgi:hypothetical protein
VASGEGKPADRRFDTSPAQATLCCISSKIAKRPQWLKSTQSKPVPSELKPDARCQAPRILPACWTPTKRAVPAPLGRSKDRPLHKPTPHESSPLLTTAATSGTIEVGARSRGYVVRPRSVRGHASARRSRSGHHARWRRSVHRGSRQRSRREMRHRGRRGRPAR